MKFELYSAVDTRDNTLTYWLKDLDNDLVAQYHHKTAPSRIKRGSLRHAIIVWASGDAWARYADQSTAKLIDTWEWPE